MGDDDKDNTMASATPGLPLPLELVIRIVNYCAEYDPPDDTYDHFVLQQNNGVYPVPFVHRITWPTTPWPASQNVIRVRLVCKQFRDASFQEFGKILGHRKFRLTKSDLKFLREIGQMEQLVPWIKTLTFGSARMLYPREVTSNTFGYERYLVDSLNPDIARQVEVVKEMHAKYMTENESKQPEKDLLQALAAFRKVENVRIETSDNANYLEGWLTPEQQKVVDSWNGVLCDHRGFCEAESDAPVTVLQTLDKVGISIKDLRLPYGEFRWSHVLPGSLRVLRIRQHLGGFEWQYADDAQPTLNALSRMTALEELDITLTVNFRHNYSSVLEFLAQDLFKVMSKKPNLRRIALEGHWMFDQASLCNFVRKHAATLRCLIMYGCVLKGDWLETLHDLAEITHDKLKHLGVMYPRYVSLGSLIENAKLREGWTIWAPQFSCTTDFRIFP
jgi:hypothetical protein